MSLSVRQTTTFLMQLQAEAVSGDIAPASFQRPYVWSEADVEAMWDSILMGLPIGSFLLWRPKGEVRTSRMLGPIRLRPSRSAALVLDGQNRLATLAWSSVDPTDPSIPVEASGRELWTSGRRLVADARARTVRFVDAEALEDRWLVPMVHGGNMLGRTVRAIWKGDDSELPMAEWLDHLDARTRESRVVVTTIEADETEARRAFARISRAGVPMTEADFDAAMNGAHHEA